MRFEKQTFKKQEITLDGNEYVQCRFESCTILYGGGDHIVLDSNEFMGCRWSFFGAAANTLAVMNALYAQGGDGRRLIEQTFKNMQRSTRKPGISH